MYEKVTAYTVGLITYFVWRQKECLLSLDQAWSESAFFNWTYLGQSKTVIFQFPLQFILALAGICFLFARKLN